MKKYLVIGNPIDHSLSPLLHNFWIKKHNIDAIYEKKLLKQNDIEIIISEMRKKRYKVLMLLYLLKRCNSISG